MLIYAELRAFAVDGDEIKLRPIEIPEPFVKGRNTDEILSLAFYFGQNDFQPRPFYSLSVGDVVRLNDGSRWRCEMAGWTKLN